MTWARSISILALCASLLFGLFQLVPSDRGPRLATQPIELVQPGQRVLVNPPDDALASDFARLTGTALSWDQASGDWNLAGAGDPLRDVAQATSQQIVRADYRLVKLQARSAWADGTVDEINVETLQPVTWIHHNRIHVGGRAKLPLDALEMGLPEELTGKVLDILPCPALPAGPGRIVLTTVNHLNRDVVELTLRDSHGQTETLRPTGTHKFYSVTRGEWLSASQLGDGEHLDGAQGKVTVIGVQHLRGTHRVYNMTVQGEHLYRVANCGVLVHNNRCDVVSEIGLAGSGKKIDLNLPNGFDTADGFTSFRNFKKAFGRAGSRKAWHHVVEQTINSGKYADELLHNPANLFRLPHGKGTIHSRISAYYSSKQPFTGGLTVRKWLSAKSFREQFDFGIQVIRDFGGRNYLPPQLR